VLYLNNNNNKSKSIPILVIILIASSFVLSSVSAHSTSINKKRNLIGNHEGKAACQTSPITVYNVVHSMKFLKHTHPYKQGFISGLFNGDCENWIMPGGPQAQIAYSLNTDGSVIGYSNVIPGNKDILNSNGTHTIIVDPHTQIPNLITCAVDPKTCVDGTGHFITNWSISK
jgi:hypothetical protein